MPCLGPTLTSGKSSVVLVIAMALWSWHGPVVASALLEAPPKRHESDGMSPVARIDHAIRQGWDNAGLKPSPRATDGEWCRRVYLDVIGRIPTVDELQAFLQDPSSAKKTALTDQLLGEAYLEEYSRNWTSIWTNILIGRTGGTERNSLTSRAGMESYLRGAFRQNKPYDVMVAELITATGATRPDAERFNGATNFLVSKLADNVVQATARTSQVFLGVRVQCTQCHNHPFNEWKHRQFWQMNAFFRQTRALRSFSGQELSGVRLVNQDFSGEDGDPSDAAIYFEQRNKKLQVAYPVFLDGTALSDLKGRELGNSGYLDEVNRRNELARLVLASRYLDQAIVNRMWAHFLGYGFTKPFDDMGPHNPPTCRELLEWLGDTFRQSDFDLKELIRWITLSEAYSLSSRLLRGRNDMDDPQLGVRPQFSHFYLRQMPAESLYASLRVATEAEKTWSTNEEQGKAKQDWLNQFSQAFGTDENDEATTYNGTISQALMLMNGDLVQRATSLEKGSFLYRVATNSKIKDSDRIRHLYWAALARRPTRGELRLANQLLILRSGDVPTTLQATWWALLNSNEFILNH